MYSAGAEVQGAGSGVKGVTGVGRKVMGCRVQSAGWGVHGVGAWCSIQGEGVQADDYTMYSTSCTLDPSHPASITLHPSQPAPCTSLTLYSALCTL